MAAVKLAVGASDDDAIAIAKRSDIGLDLPMGQSAQAYVASIQESLCDSRGSGCSLLIVSPSARSRQLQASALVIFRVDVPSGATDDLSANSTETALVADALTHAVEDALNVSVNASTLIATSTAVTITVIVEGAADGFAGSASSTLMASSITNSLSSQLNVSVDMLSVEAAQIILADAEHVHELARQRRRGLGPQVAEHMRLGRLRFVGGRPVLGVSSRFECDGATLPKE